MISPAARRSVRRDSAPQRAGNDCAVIKKNHKPEEIQTKEEMKTMSGTLLQAGLWVVAGLLLTMLIIRRGKRKARS
jgi:hypothetical protein